MAAGSRVRAGVTWRLRDQWGETLLIGNTPDHWLVIGAGLSISGGGRLISQSQAEVSDWSANSGPRSDLPQPPKKVSNTSMLALKSIDFLPWPQKGKRFHPSLFCLTAALENFRIVTLWTGNVSFMRYLIVCIGSHGWDASKWCHRDVSSLI